MVTAVEWIQQSSLDTWLKEAAIALVPTIPTNLAGMPYCPACESVLCGACGHCHMLDADPFLVPECPLDNDDMGADCAAWWQAFNAVQTVQHLRGEE
jgi:hypothetical protein